MPAHSVHELSTVYAVTPGLDIVAVRACSKLADPFAAGGTQVKVQVDLFGELMLNRVIKPYKQLSKKALPTFHVYCTWKTHKEASPAPQACNIPCGLTSRTTLGLGRYRTKPDSRPSMYQLSSSNTTHLRKRLEDHWTGKINNNHQIFKADVKCTPIRPAHKRP